MLNKLPEHQLSKLKNYEQLLHRWQRAINLVGPSTLHDSWNRHFADSVQLFAFIPTGSRMLYDLGSGAGFPGLVLAMIAPELSVSLIESDQKKCAFLSTVSHETETPVTVLNQRIEEAALILPAPDIVTARALAPLTDLLSYIKPWVKNNAQLSCLFLKGKSFEEELKNARMIADFHLEEMASATNPEGRILLLRSIRYLD